MPLDCEHNQGPITFLNQAGNMQNISHRHLDPKTFRQLTQWSVYKISRETEIPLHSLYNYLKAESDPKYREPKPYRKRLLGEIYSRLPN